MNDKRFPDDGSHGHSGVQRGLGILKNHLNVFPHSRKLGFIDSQDILIIKQDTPTVCIDETTEKSADRCFAAARLTNQPHGLSVTDGQTYIIDGLHSTLPEPERATEGKAFFQVRYIEEFRQSSVPPLLENMPPSALPQLRQKPAAQLHNDLARTDIADEIGTPVAARSNWGPLHRLR